MTTQTRFFVLWVVFAVEAFAIATWAAWDTAVVDVALLVAFILGMPLSLLLATVACRKPLMLTIGLGTLLIACGVMISTLVFGGINPVVLGVLVLLSAGVLWAFLPNAPRNIGGATCPRCGYSLEGLPSNKCPECGNAIAGVTPECTGTDE
jgi:hypothetical protein